MVTLVRPRRGQGDRSKGTMRLAAHLAELRRRLFISFIALLVAAVAAFALTDPIIHFLASPIRDIAAKQGDSLTALTFTTVTAAFDLRLRIAIAVGAIVACPIWLLQIWLFLVPGLTRREVRWTLGFVFSAIPLFIVGCATGVLIAPHTITLLASFVPEGSALLLQSAYYYDFVLKLMLAVGVAFSVPVFLVMLNLSGLVSSQGLLRGWRIAVVASAVFAALATPAADVISMLLLMAAITTLYFGAWFVTVLLERRSRRGLERSPGAGAAIAQAVVAD
ncbi:twin-arginine translocase subunit TatC [Microbacterium paraoxydans]|uniref:twin-arginine translocase subunit TatC n=1 Tax=Microbacterium paraoxydans TaxID=199592 RepID=UPI001F06A557|nr:twin-arginine translocase subunit TatC [Microbacterium paraoxydans]